MKQGSATIRGNEKNIRSQLLPTEHSLYYAPKSWNQASTIKKYFGAPWRNRFGGQGQRH